MSEALLSRTNSVHGAGYDRLLASGIPRRMVRRAWIAAGAEYDAAMRFIRDNFDATDDFWDVLSGIPEPPAAAAGAAPAPDGPARAGEQSLGSSALTAVEDAGDGALLRSRSALPTLRSQVSGVAEEGAREARRWLRKERGIGASGVAKIEAAFAAQVHHK
jgi:superfamily I DNA/RNA helicase